MTTTQKRHFVSFTRNFLAASLTMLGYLLFELRELDYATLFRPENVVYLKGALISAVVGALMKYGYEEVNKKKK